MHYAGTFGSDEPMLIHKHKMSKSSQNGIFVIRIKIGILLENWEFMETLNSRFDWDSILDLFSSKPLLAKSVGIDSIYGNNYFFLLFLNIKKVHGFLSDSFVR
jgi:hypothetical protein